MATTTISTAATNSARFAGVGYLELDVEFKAYKNSGGTLTQLATSGVYSVNNTGTFYTPPSLSVSAGTALGNGDLFRYSQNLTILGYNSGTDDYTDLIWSRTDSFDSTAPGACTTDASTWANNGQYGGGTSAGSPARITAGTVSGISYTAGGSSGNPLLMLLSQEA